MKSLKKPNLLFLFTDQQRADTLSAYGNNEIEMPHLNRLASQSTVFEKTYVTQPVCTPSRSSIMSGFYPHTTGCVGNNVALPRDMKCLPEMLTGDYVTAYHGKWHLGDEVSAQHGFQQWVSVEDGYAKHSTNKAPSSYHEFLVKAGLKPSQGDRFKRNETARFPEEFSKPAFLGQTASKFIRENAKNPFVLYVNFLEPHSPVFGPRDNQYDPAKVRLPSNFNTIPHSQQPLYTQYLYHTFKEKGFSQLPLKTEADWRRMIANYWGLCSLVDTHVGKILQTLEETGVMDNTIVVFTSDHGDLMGSHQLAAKTVMYEEAVRVPLLIRTPGQKVQRKVAQPVSLIDVVPTLLDLMGEKIPSQLHGTSLKPCITGSAAPTNQEAFFEWNRGKARELNSTLSPQVVNEIAASVGSMESIEKSMNDNIRSVVTADGWKLNLSEIGENELYDLNADPGETTNRISDPSCQNRMGELSQKIFDWQKKTGDPLKLSFVEK